MRLIDEAELIYNEIVDDIDLVVWDEDDDELERLDVMLVMVLEDDETENVVV